MTKSPTNGRSVYWSHDTDHNVLTLSYIVYIS